LTESAPAAPIGLRRAGLLPRLGAVLYEALLVTALAFMTGFLTLPLVSPRTAATATQLTVPPVPARVALFCIVFSVIALYYVWCWTGGRRTLPMKTWRMRIANADGGPPAARTALLRYLSARIGPLLALVGSAFLKDRGLDVLWLVVAGFNFLWAAVDPDRQFLHDRIAGTRIVRDA